MDVHPILLVEDTEADELLILRALKRAHVANPVDVVRDGQQALDYLFGEGEFADCGAKAAAVVLLDIRLPRVSGLDVLTRLRADARTAHLRVVVLTASSDDQDPIQSHLKGANCFVRKPFDFGEFAQTVARLGVYWLAMDAVSA